MEQQVIIPSGRERLHGVLHLPPAAQLRPVPVVVICHGFISNKMGQHRLFVTAAREFCRRGWAVLRFDYAGCGDSSGEYQDITLDQQLAETKSVLDFVAAQPMLDRNEIVLLGHSFGGCLATLTAARDARVKRLVLWSPVARPLVDIVSIVGRERYQACLTHGSVAYQGFTLGQEFFASLRRFAPLHAARALALDVLVLHGSADTDTPLMNAKFYEKALRERRQGRQALVVLEGADHTYTQPRDKQAVIAETLAWLAPDARYYQAHLSG